METQVVTIGSVPINFCHIRMNEEYNYERNRISRR